jgi:hypothetical protein
MDIDEPGRDDVTVHVDRAHGRLVDRGRDAGDRIAPDGEVAAIPRTAGAIDDAGVLEQQIVRRGLLRKGEEAGGKCERGVTHGGIL